ncbi:hypothetical protein EON81_14235 [bacterium]|nr:MAG: hypothetical protein EON81_14235 [bacterium]
MSRISLYSRNVLRVVLPVFVFSALLGAAPVPRPVVASKVTQVILPSAMYGHNVVLGKVRISPAAPPGGQEVFLDSSSSALGVPDSIFVKEGQYYGEFEAVSDDVAAAKSATVMAQTFEPGAQDTIQVKPLAVTSFVVDSSSGEGGLGQINAVVKLNVPVAFDTPVTFTTSNNAAISAPTGIYIPAGSNQVEFFFTTHSVFVPMFAKITVIKNATSQYRTIKVKPGPSW